MGADVERCPVCGTMGTYEHHADGWVTCSVCGIEANREAAQAMEGRAKRMYPRQNGKSTRAVDEALEEMGYVRKRTCRMERRAWPGDSATLHVCSECGGWTYTEDAPRYCAFCGAKVVDE